MHVNVRGVRLFTAEDLYYLSFAKDVLFSFLGRRMRNNFVYVPCRCCYLSIHQSVSVALWGWGRSTATSSPSLHLYSRPSHLFTVYNLLDRCWSIKYAGESKSRRRAFGPFARRVCQKKLNQGVASIWATLSGGDWLDVKQQSWE